MALQINSSADTLLLSFETKKFGPVSDAAKIKLARTTSVELDSFLEMNAIQV